MKLEKYIDSQLELVKKTNLLRTIDELNYPAALWVEMNGKQYLNLCSNNYLCYADHPEIKKAAIDAINSYGIGSTGSRLITGTSLLHSQLEDKIAEFKGCESAMFLSSGYVANLSTISAILNIDDVIFSDELNHASIIDGIKLSRANKFIYKHNNMQHLETLLKDNRHKFNKSMIVTDSIFSMDGDMADLNSLIELKNKYNSFLMIDEAHATGIIGKNGSGMASHLNVNNCIDISMGTFSKAAGVEGAYISGSSKLIDYLRHYSRGFVFSTAPSPAIAGAIIKSIELMTNDNFSRQKLWENVAYFKNNLSSIAGLELIPNNSPIFCLIVGDTETTLLFQRQLLEDYRIFIKAIRPPTVKSSRIRLCLNSQLTCKELDFIINAIKSIYKKY
ncbi:MAG: pyridoxal phosphate-dependent aminotransferase family protein [Cyanobacteriota bacterium]